MHSSSNCLGLPIAPTECIPPPTGPKHGSDGLVLWSRDSRPGPVRSRIPMIPARGPMPSARVTYCSGCRRLVAQGLTPSSHGSASTTAK